MKLGIRAAAWFETRPFGPLLTMRRNDNRRC